MDQDVATARQRPQMSGSVAGSAGSPQPYDGFGHLPIGGQWRSGGGEPLRDINPYSGDVLLEIPQGGRQELEDAYAGSAEAQGQWSAMAASARSEVFGRAVAIMEARRGEIVDWLIREAGSARVKAELEFASAHAIAQWAQSVPVLVEGRMLATYIPGKESRVHRKPVGVVGVISPWNWPFHLGMRSVAPALATGNAVVVKPASDTPVTGGLLLAKIFEEAGLPPGVLSVVIAPGSEIGDAFVTHDVPRVLSFTGSTEVGKHIGQLASTAPILKQVDLELGGDGPFVVLEDAELDHAVEAAVFGKFLHQGQICIAINRLIVVDAIHDAFVERFVERVKSLKVGDPQDEDTFIGPIINKSQFDRVMRLIESARAAGATQLAGGKPQGLTIPPHVFTGVTNGMEIARNEIFGPVAPIIRVRDEEEALKVANDTDRGLSGAVFTRDLARGARFADRLQVGMSHVNDTPVIDLPNSPFGGEKNSGIGRFNGTWAIEAFTTDQWLTVQQRPRRYPWHAGEVQGPWG